MTIRKGEPWGEPSDALAPVTAADDAELARLAFEAHLQGVEFAASVSSGDLLRSLGLNASRSQDTWRYPVDLGLAFLDDREPVAFLANVIVPALPAQGTAVVVMNAPVFRSFRLGPRAHLNDGVLDITEGWIPPSQWREALRRARSGSHLPHPNLRTRRVATGSFEFRRRVVPIVDGRPRRPCRMLRVEVVPDALHVVV